MSERSIPGTLLSMPDAAAVAREASARVADALRRAVDERGQASLALSGGNTPRDAYTHLAHEPGIDWSRVDVLWVDERAVPPTDDRSNFRWAKATLLDGAKVPSERIHRMPAESDDLYAAARAYEELLRRRVPAGADGIPALDVAVLGIGDDGHTASLFPGEATVNLRQALVAAVGSHQGLEPRMTLTAPALEHARHLAVLAVGKGKHPALSRAWAPEGDLSATPVRLLRAAKGEVWWIVDRAAAGG
jgi:6-phosphogluconolactonase